MDLKGKVVEIRKGWGGMYPTMDGKEDGNRPEVVVELEGNGGRLCLNLSPKEAREFRLEDQVTVTVSAPARKE